MSSTPPLSDDPTSGFIYLFLFGFISFILLVWPLWIPYLICIYTLIRDNSVYILTFLEVIIGNCILPFLLFCLLCVYIPYYIVVHICIIYIGIYFYWWILLLLIFLFILEFIFYVRKYGQFFYLSMLCKVVGGITMWFVDVFSLLCAMIIIFFKELKGNELRAEANPSIERRPTCFIHFAFGDDAIVIERPPGIYSGLDVFGPIDDERDLKNWFITISDGMIKFPITNMFHMMDGMHFYIHYRAEMPNPTVFLHTDEANMFNLYPSVYSRVLLERELRAIGAGVDRFTDVSTDIELDDEIIVLEPYGVYRGFEGGSLLNPESVPGPRSSEAPKGLVILEEFQSKLGDEDLCINENNNRKGERCKACVSYLEKRVLHEVLSHKNDYLLSEKSAKYMYERIPWCSNCKSKFSPTTILNGFNFVVVHRNLYERRRRIQTREMIEAQKIKQKTICAKRLEEAKKHVWCDNSAYPKQQKKKKGRVHRKRRLPEVKPEGLFTVSLDQSSREFMQNLVGQLVTQAGSLAHDVSRQAVVRVKFDFVGHFVDSFNSFINWIKSLLGPIKRFVLFIIELLTGFIKGPVRNACNFVLIALGIKDNPEEKEYDSEMKVGSLYDNDLNDDLFHNQEERIEPESKENAIALGFVSILYSKYLKNMIDYGDFRMFTKAFAEAIKTSEGIGGLIRPLYEFTCNIINGLLEYFGMKPFCNTYWFRDSGEARFFERLRAIREGMKSGRLSDSESGDSLIILRDDLDYFVSNLPPSIKNSTLVRLNTLYRALQPLVEEAEQVTSPNRGVRMEPLSMCVAGPSGVGKSTATHSICYALMQRLLPEKDLERFEKCREDFIFFRNSINDFWEGYRRGNFAVVYDDWGQIIDTPGAPNRDFLELIKLKNVSPFHGHMAAIEKKSGTYIHPKLIFCSTNMMQLQTKSIYCPEAVERRFDITVVQVPKKEYCREEGLSEHEYAKRRLDSEKVYRAHPYNALQPETAFPIHVYEFVEWDLRRGCRKDGGRIWSFDELVDLGCARFAEMQSKWKRVKAMHDSILLSQKLKRKEGEYMPGPIGDSQIINSLQRPLSSIVSNAELRPEGLFAEDMYCAWCKKKIGNGDTDVDKLPEVLEAHRLGCPFLILSPQRPNVTYRNSYFKPWRWLTDTYRNFLNWVVDRAYASVFQGVRIMGEKVVSKAVQIGKYLAYLAGLIGAGFVGFKLARSVIDGFSPSAESGPVGNQRNKERAPLKKPRRLVVVPQSGVENNIQFVDALWTKSMYSLRLHSTQTTFGFALFIVGSIFVVPAHFNEVIMGAYQPDEPKLVEFLLTDSRGVAFTIDWDEQDMMTRNEKDDILFVRIRDPGIRPHRDLTGHGIRACNFISENDPRLKEGRTYLAHLPVYSTNYRPKNQLVQGKIAPSTSYHFGDDKNKARAYFNNKLEYRAATKFGDCGAPLVPDDSSFPIPTVLGIHVAGDPRFDNGTSLKRCCGFFISKELVDFAYNHFKQKPCDDISDMELPQVLGRDVDEEKVEFVEATDDDRSRLVPEGVYHGFQSIGKGPIRNIPGKTKLRKSALFGLLWDPTTAPARLRPFRDKDGNIIDPLFKAQQKYLHDEKYVNQELLAEILKDFAGEVLDVDTDRKWPPRLFTMKEAVDGIIGEKGAEGIDRDTSQGAPDVWLPGTKIEKLGKKQEFDEHREQFSEVRADILRTIDLAERGVRRLHLYIDCLKDERRKLAKVLAGSTRQFMAVSMRYLIPFKMYFGDFMRYMQQGGCRLYNGCAVGINPYTEWGEIVALSRRVNDPVYIAGDFEGYDGRLRACLLAALLEIIELFYLKGKEYTLNYLREKAVRDTLFAEVYNSIHLVEGVIYMFAGSQASGMPMTAILNSMATCVMCYMCIKKICDDNGIAFRLRDFWVLAFGDDNIIALPRSLCHIIHQRSIAKYMKELFDMTYTAEDKVSDVKDVREITEITFLKRGFRWDSSNRSWDAPLDIEVLKEILNWEQVTMNRKDTILNIECVLFELTLHGEEVFNAHAPLIVQRSAEVYNYTPKGRTFRAAQTERWGLY